MSCDKILYKSAPGSDPTNENELYSNDGEYYAPVSKGKTVTLPTLRFKEDKNQNKPVAWGANRGEEEGFWLRARAKKCYLMLFCALLFVVATATILVIDGGCFYQSGGAESRNDNATMEGRELAEACLVDVDVEGGNHEVTMYGTPPDAQDCQDACRDAPSECDFFVWLGPRGHTPNGCWLKRFHSSQQEVSLINKNAVIGAVSGTPFCKIEQAPLCYRRRVIVIEPSQVLSKVKQISAPEECQRRCNSHNKCNVWSWRSRGQCSLAAMEGTRLAAAPSLGAWDAWTGAFNCRFP